MQPFLKLIDDGHKARYWFARSKVSGYVLDAACGVGYGSQMMFERCDVVGVDIEPEAIDYARQYYPGPEYRLANVETMEPSAYDWVVSFETIEHLKRPELALAGFRASKNLIISTPNQDYYPFRPEQYTDSKYPHQRHYTPSEFEELLNGSGWKVKERWGQEQKRSEVSRGTGMFMVYVCE